MNKNLKLNKKQTLCNVSNSILNHFKANPFHETYQPLDLILKKTKKEKVCLILFDAMGKVIIEKYKDDCPFIYNHIYKEFKSVYPPTTVAATTSLTTGKYPIETGYLGWSEYFKEFNDVINVFPSTSRLIKNKVYEPAIQRSLLKISYIWDEINKAHDNEEIATALFSFNFEKPELSQDEVLENFFNETDKLLKTHNFIYSYCTEPDHTMHLNGVGSIKTKEIIIKLNSKLEELVNKNPETLFILVADHGMVDVDLLDIRKYPDFMKTLKDDSFKIEPRLASFNVLDEEKFLEEYRKNFSDKFILKTKANMINEHVFGYGKPSTYALETIGDYVFIANSHYMLVDGYGADNMKANHAGCTGAETQLYMMIFND